MRLRVAAVLAFTALCLATVLWGIDLRTVGDSLEAVNWPQVLLVLSLYFGAHLLRSLRMLVLLEKPVRFGRILSLLSVGYLAIQVVPFRMGEFVRPYLLMEREGVPFGTGLAVILVERLADMIMLLCMFLGLAWVVEMPAETLVIGGVDVVVRGQQLIGTLVAGGCFGVLAVAFFGETVLQHTDRLPLGSLVRKFYEGILLMKRNPLRMVAVMGLSVSIWLVTIAGVWLMLRAFPGLPSRFDQAFAVWTITLAGMTVVPTPGFFGSFEAACTGILALYGTSLDAARTFAVVLHLSQFFFTIALGVVFLLVEGLSLGEVVGRSQAAAREQR